MKRVDYLIIGQGLAGTCLAICLLRAGKRILLVDEYKLNSSSKVAAGFLHPITGRRIVKTWMADQLFPFAVNYYRNIEAESGKIFFHPMKSLEMVTQTKQLNDWNERSADPNLKLYIQEESGSEVAIQLQHHLKRYLVSGGGWLDIAGLLDHFMTVWKQNEVLKKLPSEISDPSDYRSLTNSLDIEADRIIYCEGHSAAKNPLWSWLPFDPAKGELLTVEIPGLEEKHIIVNGIFIIPLGKSRFRVGSTYSWHSIDDIPTEKARLQLTEKLENTIRLPFSLVDQKAGIRPAVKGRRPLIGQHPEHKKCWIFNGLGSKGGTLAPWFAQHLSEHFLQGKDLLPEVDIARFGKG
jgi:glycine/D-amino acid oxidase-like deaminating enzyme